MVIIRLTAEKLGEGPVTVLPTILVGKSEENGFELCLAWINRVIVASFQKK